MGRMRRLWLLLGVYVPFTLFRIELDFVSTSLKLESDAEAWMMGTREE